MTSGLWLGVVAMVGAGPAAADGGGQKPLEHVLDVRGLPEGVALLVAHDKRYIDKKTKTYKDEPTSYLTVIRADGRHSLAGWYPVTRHAMSSPRVLAVPTRDLGRWLDQAESVVAAFDRKERAWLRAPETARGRQPRLEVELPPARVDCDVGLRIQRRGPSYWPDQYVEVLEVTEAHVVDVKVPEMRCSVRRTQPDLPGVLAGVSWAKMAGVALVLLAGAALLVTSLRRAERR